MRKDFEQLFSNLKPKEPRKGLFIRIILAIQREQELRKTRKIFFSFVLLLMVSFIAMPFSLAALLREIENSGIFYLISAGLSDFQTFLALWQDFGLAILESLPVASMVIFSISLGTALFTLRLFLYRKRLLLGYLMQEFHLIRSH